MSSITAVKFHKKIGQSHLDLYFALFEAELYFNVAFCTIFETIDCEQLDCNSTIVQRFLAFEMNN